MQPLSPLYVAMGLNTNDHPWFFLETSKFSIVHRHILGLLDTSFSRDGCRMDTHKKIDYIRYVVDLEHSPKIVCITETKLSKCIGR